jgi:phosphoglycerate dehydrogenase-like enzyme
VRIAILDDIHRVWEDTDGVRRLRERADVQVFTSPFGDPVMLRGFDALIANRERTTFTRELFDQLHDLRVLVQTGNHANHIDFAAARDRGIVIAQASAGYSVGAAELAIALATAVMRQIPATDAAVRRGEWPAPSTPVMHGKTMGVVGVGRVGRHVARIANAFGMRVLGWSPRLTDITAASAGVERRNLDDLMRESDVISVHVSLAPTSHGLIDARRIGLMKPTAFLINTARGPIVDEAALIAALADK